MTLKTWTTNERITVSQINGNNIEVLGEAGRDHIRQLINRTGVYSKGNIDGWGEAYIDTNGRNNSISAVGATFSTDKYTAINLPYYWVIEATSLTVGDFAINNCLCKQITTGKWLLYSTRNTVAECKADIIMTLFYNDKISSITGLTALKSSLSTDVGKRVYKATISESHAPLDGATYNAEYILTFTDTTNNYDVNSWSYLTKHDFDDQTVWGYYNSYTGTSGGYLSYIPWNQSSYLTLNEIGVGNGDSNNNPARMFWRHSNDGSDSMGTDHVSGNICIVFAASEGTWATGGNAGDYADWTGTTNTDYYTAGTMPLITQIDSMEELSTISHTIPSGTFSNSINTSIGIPLISDWEEENNIQYKLLNDTENTGWLNFNEIQTFIPFTSEPTTLTVKLIPKTTSPTAGYPSIKGFWIRAT